MSWQDLAAERRSDELTGDESVQALVRAWNNAYDAAAELASTAAAEGGPWFSTDEWNTVTETAGVHDAVNDLINDGIIAVAQDLGIPISDTLLGDAINPFAESISGAVDFVRDLLDVFHREHRGEGWPPRRWRSALRDTPSSPLSTGRASRFAVSQANGALNAGYHAGLNACAASARQFAVDTPADCNQVAAIRWVTQRDERVRPAHQVADKNTILLGHEFSIDGHPARFPGDPNLPIRLRINCRCYLAWVDGTAVRRIAGALKSELLATARTLDIPGRSKMTKAQLQSAILERLCLQGLAGGPDCPDVFDLMNRSALMTYARQEGIVGRWRMTKPELIEQLRSTMRGGDRIRAAAGFVPRSELDAAHRLAARKRRSLPDIDTIGGLPPTAVRRASRQAVFAEFGGVERGYAPCVFCGLKLHPNPTSGFAVLIPTPIRSFADGGIAAAVNMLPGCAACFRAHSAARAASLVASGPERTEEFDGDLDDVVMPERVRQLAEDRLRELFGDDALHLKGTANDHDQKTHGGGGGGGFDTTIATIYDDVEITDDQGDKYVLRLDERSGRNRRGEYEVYGQILDDQERQVGEFARVIDDLPGGGVVYNNGLDINSSHRGRGIGTAFLDTTEQALIDAGIHTAEVSAVNIGKYAWAARGYKLAEEYGTDVKDSWIKAGRSSTPLMEARGEITERQASLVYRLLQEWDGYESDVYPADLLAISPGYRDVFAKGPTWSGTLDLIRHHVGRRKPIAASAPLPMDYTIRRFHLQGQHDQKTHGRRHGSPSGAKAIAETAADRAWAQRNGNSRLSGEGDCFPAAAHVMLDKMSDPDVDDYRLVHGVVTGQEELDGVRFDHAWVERTERVPIPADLLDKLSPEQRERFDGATFEYVIDRSNGGNVNMLRARYYHLGQIDETEVRRYTIREAMKAMARTGHYGPWDDEDDDE